MRDHRAAAAGDDVRPRARNSYHPSHNNDNKVLIAEIGGFRCSSPFCGTEGICAKSEARWALRSLARNNEANAVAIAAAFSSDALVELARRGRVTFAGEPRWISPLLSNASIPAKRKAALVVAALLGGCVPDSARDRVPDVIKAAIGSYL